MTQFRPFEVEAIKKLAANRLENAVVDAVIGQAVLISYKFSGSGYFLTVGHPLLRGNRMTLDSPILVGRVGDIVGTFLAFVQDAELMLEFAGFTDVPQNIRDLDIEVSVQANAT